MRRCIGLVSTSARRNIKQGIPLARIAVGLVRLSRSGLLNPPYFRAAICQRAVRKANAQHLQDSYGPFGLFTHRVKGGARRAGLTSG